MFHRSWAPAIALILATTASAAGQESPKSKNTGFLLGLHLNGTAASYENNDEVESGGGLGFTIGYGFTPRFTLYLTSDAGLLHFNDWVWSGEYAMGHFDLGARFNFAGEKKTVVPYLDGALTGRAIASTIDFQIGNNVVAGNLDITGGSVTAGGGLEVFFNPKLALDLGLKWSVGNFDRFRFEGEELNIDENRAVTTRINVGMSWRP